MIMIEPKKFKNPIRPKKFAQYQGAASRIIR